MLCRQQRNLNLIHLDIEPMGWEELDFFRETNSIIFKTVDFICHCHPWAKFLVDSDITGSVGMRNRDAYDPSKISITWRHTCHFDRTDWLSWHDQNTHGNQRERERERILILFSLVRIVILSVNASSDKRSTLLSLSSACHDESLRWCSRPRVSV